MNTEGPIYTQPNPNDYSGILNLYLRCPKKNEVSLINFTNDYREKFEYVINYLRVYETDLASVKVTATNLVEAYYLSDRYSILEDSTQVFQAFMEEYFHNLKVVADVLNGSLKQGVTK